jgi:hypothetical protein
MPQIEVTVTATGDTTVKAQGVKGAGCKKLTEGIERAIGATVSDTPTPELHQTATTGQAATVPTSR